MANRSGAEPTEQPTPKRLRDARNKGQVARSQELSAALGFAAAGGVLLYTGPGMWRELGLVTHASLANAVVAEDPISLVAAASASIIETVLMASLPIAVTAAVAAGITGYVQIGFLFITKPLTPDVTRINPVEGAKRLLSKRTLVELAKSIVKIVLITYLAYDVLRDRVPEFGTLAGGALESALVWTAQLAADVLVRVVIAYVVIGMLDLMWQRHVTTKNLMMTREEVKREFKDQEGDPQHKADRQRLHRDILQHQMLQAVRNADAVIVNPDHVAVAIRYNADVMDAPRVVASGRRLVAQQIKDIARRYGVPIYRDVPLARACAELELDSEIPEELYEAVATVLRFVHADSGGSQPSDHIPSGLL